MSYREIRKKYLSFNCNGMTIFAVVVSLVWMTACTDQAKAKPSIVYKDAPKAGVVAKIGDQEITEDMLVGDDKLDFYEIKKREYELKMERLNKLMVDQLVGTEAKKAGMSTDDYISKKVIGNDLKISDKEYKKFVADKHIPEAQITPDIKKRIMDYLQALKKQDLVTAYIAKLTKGHPVEVYFNKPKMQMKVEAGQGPTFGKEGAPVTVVEFSDFQCPFCSRAAETVSQLKKKYGNKIRLTFRNFPLPMHREARPSAEAAMCVNDQGTEKFWKFHDKLFKNQDKLDKANLEKFAKEVGADVNKYTACINAKKYSDFVQKDIEYGEKIGVKSTPTFFINGELVSGAVPLDTFTDMIDEDLSAKR